MAKANPMYKDTVFRMLFKEPKEALSLYNALNGTKYDDPTKLEIVTLENAIYLNMKNDVAIMIDSTLNLYEHQSTPNPNMPLRDLYYVSGELQRLFPAKNLYGRTKKTIPVPRFVVFYNGEEAIEKAVKDCMTQDILKEFLENNRNQVVCTTLEEFDQELYEKIIRDEGFEQGRQEGLEEGREEREKLEQEIQKKEDEIARLRRYIDDTGK